MSSEDKMFKSGLQITRFLARVYGAPAIVWAVLQVIVIILIRKICIDTSLDSPSQAEPSPMPAFALLGLLACSYVVLLVFLGATI